MPSTTSDKLRSFFRAGTILTYQKGEVILRASETPHGVYYIEKGYVKVYTIRNSGDLNLHSIYKPGEIFPLTWALKGTGNSVFYEALNDATLRRVSKESFLRAAYSDVHIMKAVTDVLSELFWVYINRVENLELATAYERVVFRLIFIMTRFGKPGPEGSLVVDAPINQKEVADSLHMARETASREMSKLEKRGIICYNCRHLTILKPELLEKEFTRLL